jgi:hypothetical protein
MSIEQIVASTLKRLGFKRTKNYWYRDNDQTIIAICLRKFGKLRLLEFGVWVQSLETFACQSFVKFHWNFASGEFDPKFHSRNKYFDVSSAVSDAARSRVIEGFLADRLVPFLERLKSIDSLCEMTESEQNRMPLPRPTYNHCATRKAGRKSKGKSSGK